MIQEERTLIFMLLPEIYNGCTHTGNTLSSVVSNLLKCIRVSETLLCQILFVALLHAWSLEEYLFSLAKYTFDLRKLIQIYPTNDEVLSDQRGLRQG